MKGPRGRGDEGGERETEDERARGKSQQNCSYNRVRIYPVSHYSRTCDLTLFCVYLNSHLARQKHLTSTVPIIQGIPEY